MFTKPAFFGGNGNQLMSMYAARDTCTTVKPVSIWFGFTNCIIFGQHLNTVYTLQFHSKYCVGLKITSFSPFNFKYTKYIYHFPLLPSLNLSFRGVNLILFFYLYYCSHLNKVKVEIIKNKYPIFPKNL